MTRMAPRIDKALTYQLVGHSPKHVTVKQTSSLVRPSTEHVDAWLLVAEGETSVDVVAENNGSEGFVQNENRSPYLATAFTVGVVLWFFMVDFHFNISQ